MIKLISTEIHLIKSFMKESELCMNLNIAVCDDDIVSMDEEYDIICSVLSEKQMIYTINKFNTPLDLLKSEELYNIVFLDIEMSDMSGLEAAKRIHKLNRNCMIFFVTNHEMYLDEAFDRHAFRFWKKPIDRRRLWRGIQAAIDELNILEQSIKVTVYNEEISIFTRNIIYIQAKDKKTNIVTANGIIIANEPFKNVVAKLDGNKEFCDSHGSYYINFNYVTNITPTSVSCVCNDMKYDVYMSKRRYRGFRKKFLEWIGGN